MGEIKIVAIGLTILLLSFVVTAIINLIVNGKEKRLKKIFLEPVSVLNILALMLSVYVLFK